jgi:DNA gyrase subunit B
LTFFYRQMPRLVEEGHIYVARPPLFKVTQKKQVRYVRTAEEMSGELTSRGLNGTSLTILTPASSTGDGEPTPAPTILTGDRLTELLKVLNDLEGALQILERRGLSLVHFFAQNGPGGLPTYRVLLAGHEHWFRGPDEVDRFRREEEQRLGRPLLLADEVHTNGNGNGEPHVTFTVQELHEVRAVNRGLERLREFGLNAADLIPAPRIAGRDPLPRFVLENGDQRRVLPHLRDLVGEVRHIGERGLTITRFKGLGEMDGEELWETTLDPEKRTLLKVQLDDALKADEMFRTLMGEKVEPRREFIQKHALEVKDIDYHGA